MSDEMRNKASFRQDLIDPERSTMMIEKSCNLGSEYGCLNHAENLATAANWKPEELQKADLEKVMDEQFDT